MSDCQLPPHMEKEIASSRLQMVLLSPTLLQFLARNTNIIIGKLLHPDRVIAIMLGVRDSQITAHHRNHSLVSFVQWIHLEAKDHDLEFVQTVLYYSTHILQKNSKDHKRLQRLTRSTSNIANNCRPTESTSFTVHPKRINEVSALILFDRLTAFRSVIVYLL